MVFKCFFRNSCTDFYSGDLSFSGGKVKKMAVRKPFGGLTINFAPIANKPISDMYGTGKLPPSTATKKFWEYVKKHHLMIKG